MVKNTELKKIPVEYGLGVQQTIGLGIVLKAELVVQLLQVAKDGLSDRIDKTTPRQP